MNIEWKIKKKRGNFRPILQYSITLTEYETELAVSAVRVLSSIPKPPDPGWTHCWPGQNERGVWEPAEYYPLMTPSHKTGHIVESVKLPWRDNNAYPEVEPSFLQLREAFERALTMAAASAPISEAGSLETSASAKRDIAPAVAAARILQVVKR